MKQTINERIESRLLKESENKIEELKPAYGWMAYAYDGEKYKSSEIYKRKREIVTKLKQIARDYNEDVEKDIYKQMWKMITELELSPQFWTWIDYNLDKSIIFNDKFDKDQKITARFLWSAIILGKDVNEDKQEEKEETKDEQSNTEN
jgi:enoyl reductase-like protein